MEHVKVYTAQQMANEHGQTKQNIHYMHKTGKLSAIEVEFDYEAIVNGKREVRKRKSTYYLPPEYRIMKKETKLTQI